MILRSKLALAVTLSISAVTAHAYPLIYALADSGEFGTIDTATGTFTSIGPGLPVGAGGLVQGPGGNLLTLGFDGTLNRINPTTGVLSAVGPTGLGDCSLPSSPCGLNSASTIGKVGSSIYATDLANNLYSVNPVTGAATLIGATGIPALPFIPHALVPGDPNGSFYVYDENLFDFGGDLYANFDTGTLDPTTFTPTQLIGPQLYKINTTTGLATSIGPTVFGLEGIANVDGTLYAVNLPTSTIVTLNLANGNTIYVSDLDPAAGLVSSATAASPVPEPASLALVGSGLAAIAAGMRRRYCA